MSHLLYYMGEGKIDLLNETDLWKNSHMWNKCNSNSTIIYWIIFATCSRCYHAVVNVLGPMYHKNVLIFYFEFSWFFYTTSSFENDSNSSVFIFYYFFTTFSVFGFKNFFCKIQIPFQRHDYTYQTIYIKFGNRLPNLLLD